MMLEISGYRDIQLSGAGCFVLVGTDVDAANLYQTFKILGFDVHMFNNQKTTEMLRILTQGRYRLIVTSQWTF